MFIPRVAGLVQAGLFTQAAQFAIALNVQEHFGDLIRPLLIENNFPLMEELIQHHKDLQIKAVLVGSSKRENVLSSESVSYTHLTLPTIYSV